MYYLCKSNDPFEYEWCVVDDENNVIDDFDLIENAIALIEAHNGEAKND